MPSSGPTIFSEAQNTGTRRSGIDQGQSVTARPRERLNWLAAAAVLALILLSGFLVFGFVRSAKLANDLDRGDKQQLAANYLNQSTATLINQQKAQITWDDSFRQIGIGQNLEWADQNVGGFLWNEFAHDHNILVNPQGDFLRGWSRGELARLEAFAPLHARIRAIMSFLEENQHVLGTATRLKPIEGTKWPVDATGRPLSRWYGEQIEFDGKPALLTIMSILPDVTYDLVTKTPNHVVTIRFIDDRFLQEMSAALLLKDVQFQRRVAPDSALNAIPIVPTKKGYAGYLIWRSGQPGDKIFIATLPLLAIVLIYCLVALSVGWFLLQRMRATARELAVSEAQAKHASLHDAMSSLPNRRHFQRELSEWLALLKRSTEDQIILVAFVDLDRFKDVNDTLGHKAGDDLIRIVSKRLRAGLPDGDMLARLGGDEFVVMRATSRHKSAVRKLGVQLTRIVSKPVHILGQELTVGASVGISLAPDHGDDPGELLRHADIALYQAKQKGRGRWCAFVPSMDEHVRARREIEVELRKAISEGQFDIAYQPIISARGEKMVSAEALLRWDMPGKGLVSPGLFVPVAEQTGQMVRLGLWIVRRVFEDCKEWPGFDVSVNLSPMQIVSPAFITSLRAIVAETGVDPRRITFEVTEGVLLDRTDQVLTVLAQLRAMGFKIALDDFGTGYSSLGYLRSFRFDKIKIDQSFVQNVENDLDALQVLKAVVALGKSLQMVVVAEGVETLLQRELVAAAGCQEIQGFFYSRPVARSAISRMIGISGKHLPLALAKAA